jgi:hypothetical protein
MTKVRQRFPQKPTLQIRKDRIYWDEDEWGVLANFVVEMRRSSVEPISTLATRAQERLPPNRRRKNLSLAALKPLLKRVFQRERELFALAQEAEQLRAKLSFCEDLPKQRQELIETMDDDAVLTHFLPRVLQLVAPEDLLHVFSAEVLLAVVPTSDLAAAFAKRLVQDLMRPTVILPRGSVAKEAPSPTRTVHQQTTQSGKSNGSHQKRRVLIVGTRTTSQQKKISEGAGDLVQLRFLEAAALRNHDFPSAVDHVIVWAQMIGGQQMATVKAAYPPRKTIVHVGGVEQMVEVISELACVIR